MELEWDELIESTAERVLGTEQPESFQEGKSVQQELASVANSVPAAAVLEAFSRVERRLREIIEPLREAYSISSATGYSSQRRSVRWMAMTALKAKLIDDDIYKAIVNLSHLRNEAAHRVGDADITKRQAQDYLELVDRVLANLDGKPPFPGS